MPEQHLQQRCGQRECDTESSHQIGAFSVAEAPFEANGFEAANDRQGAHGLYEIRHTQDAKCSRDLLICPHGGSWGLGI